jgi:hypothetical protein
MKSSKIHTQCVLEVHTQCVLLLPLQYTAADNEFPDVYCNKYLMLALTGVTLADSPLTH